MWDLSTPHHVAGLRQRPTGSIHGLQGFDYLWPLLRLASNGLRPGGWAIHVGGRYWSVCIAPRGTDCLCCPEHTDVLPWGNAITGAWESMHNSQSSRKGDGLQELKSSSRGRRGKVGVAPRPPCLMLSEAAWSQPVRFRLPLPCAPSGRCTF